MWDFVRSENEVAVDFSDGMLGELRQAVTEAGVEDRFSIFRRAWQESWDGVMMDYAQETRWAVLCWRPLLPRPLVCQRKNVVCSFVRQSASRIMVLMR